MATINMLVGQKVTLSIIPTKSGIDADLEGIPTWVAGNPALLGLLPAADGRTCEVSAKAVGSTTVTANAQGASPLSANHTIAVAAASSDLATAISLALEQPPA
jgi:hypothetical protein